MSRAVEDELGNHRASNAPRQDNRPTTPPKTEYRNSPPPERNENRYRFQIIRSAVPKVVDATTKGLTKVGDGISSFFWRNKGAIVSGTALVTVTTNPEPFIDGAVAVAAGPPTVIVQNTDGGSVVVPADVKRVARRVRSTSDWSGYIVLAGLMGMCGLIVLYEAGGRARTVAKIVTVALLVGFVLFCCGVARADVSGVDADVVACTIWPGFFWKFIVDLLLIILVLLPFG